VCARVRACALQFNFTLLLGSIGSESKAPVDTDAASHIANGPLVLTPARDVITCRTHCFTS